MKNIDWEAYAKEHGTTAFPGELLKKYSGDRVLDIGCGVGDHLAKTGSAIKVGIELARTRLVYGKKKYPETHFLQADATRLPFKDNSFDTVITVDVIEHVPKYSVFVREAHRVLKPGGVLLVQTPNYPIKRFYDYVGYLNPRSDRKSPSDDPTHCSKLGYLKFRNVLHKYFDDVTIQTRNLLLDNRIPLLKKLRPTIVGNLFGQKLIGICKKSR